MTAICEERFRALPKAKLKYDRYWHCTEKKNVILENLVSNLSRLNIALANSCQFLQVDEDDKQTDEKEENVLKEEQQSLHPIKIPQEKSKQNNDSNYYNAVNKTIHLYEDEERKIIQNKVEFRKSILQENLSLIHQQVAQKFKQFQTLRDKELNEQALNIVQELEKNKTEIKIQAENYKELHKQHAMMLAAKTWRIEEEIKRKEIEKKHKLDKVLNIQKEINDIYNSILNELRNCQQQHSFYSANIHFIFNKIKTYSENIGSVALEVEAQNEIDDQLVSQSQDLLLKTKEQYGLFQDEIKSLLAKQAAVEEIIDISPATEKVESEAELPDSGIPSENGLQDTFEKYSHLIDHLSNTCSIVSEFSNNPNNKKIKFSLQKASVVLINKLAESYLPNAYKLLSSLLQGNTVQSGGSTIKASNYENGGLYCQYMIANSIVKQGEETVSVNPEAAYPLAALAVALSKQFPDFGKLLKATFYCKCPYLAPVYIPRRNEMSTDEYYRSLGYLYKDGKMETEVKFLKRMSGIAHLYGAMAQTDNSTMHPFTIDKMYVWLAEILNLDPRPNITATVIHEILVSSGWLLGKTYGQQFKKILHFMCKEYFPKLKEVTPKDCYGPLTRLELFLHRVLQKGSIPTPPGYKPFNLH